MSDKDEAKLNESNSSDAKKSLSKNKGGSDTLNDRNNSKNNENNATLEPSSENRVTIPPPPPPSTSSKTPMPPPPSPPPQPSSISAPQTTAKPTTPPPPSPSPPPPPSTRKNSEESTTTRTKITAKPTTGPSPSTPTYNTGTQNTAIPEGSDTIVQGNHAYDKSQRVVESGVSNSVGENEDKNGRTLRVANITSNYFCFDCGAIMTTIEDKEQHLLIESERRNNGESEGAD